MHERTIDQIAKQNVTLRQKHLEARAEFYSFLCGKIHPTVLTLLKTVDAGREAQRTEKLDALMLVEALRTLAQGRLQVGVEKTWKEAKKAYEQAEQGDKSLLEYSDEFNIIRANYESAGGAERLRREEYMNQEDAGSDDSTMASTVLGELGLESTQDSIVRFVDGLRPENEKAYPNAYEAAAVRDFQKNFNDPKTGVHFRSEYCANLEVTYGSILAAIRNRKENPEAADLLLERVTNGGHHGGQRRGAYIAAAASTNSNDHADTPVSTGAQDGPTNKKPAMGALNTPRDGDQAAQNKKRGKGPDKTNSKCSLCGETGHWWADGACEQGRKEMAKQGKSQPSKKNKSD